MNPEFSKLNDGQDSGVSPQSPINEPSFNVRQGLNTYDLSYQNLLTARYGDITPYFYFKGIGRDRIELRSSHELRTYTLGAPLMSNLRMRKSNFSVSKKCMMPNTYQYLFVNPVKGNDVPTDAYQSIDICRLLSQLSTAGVDVSDPSFSLKCFLLYNSIVSPAGLPDLLGMSLYRLDNSASQTSLGDFNCSSDGVMESLVDSLDSSTWIISFNVVNPAGGSPYKTELVSDGSKSQTFEMLRQICLHPDCVIDGLTDETIAPITSFFSKINTSRFYDKNSLVVNIYKIIAYQMIVCQYYSNDRVDSVYNSDLWLSNMKALQQSSVNDLSFYTFELNGTDIYYDVFSRHWLDRTIELTGLDNMNCLYFWFNLFTLGSSLRYGDYFMSTRPRPLAVGDLSVPVVGNNVSVIDVTKNIQKQRFLNAVNRVGSSLLDYARGIFGYVPSDLGSCPNFISSEIVYVGSDEIDNTSESQGLVNVNLISQQSNFQYDVNLSDECYIIGLISFECTAAYRSSIERDNFHVTRFDDFIPELQHIGDQVVYRAERSGLPDSVPFGYQVRYAEFKQRFNQMHGGFCTSALAHWAFPVDTHDDVINEYTIRSKSKDFDEFYKSLTGGSLSSRFHFQISFANNVRAVRPIDYQPNLL